MKRRIIGIVAAIALAATGTVVLVSYVQSARSDAVASQRMVRVWVVKKAIAKGTKAADIAASIGRTSVANNLRAQGGVTDLKVLKGLVANAALVPGEQLLASRFDTPTVARQGDVPSGLLQVTVKLDPERALGGRVRVGDNVGVLMSFGKDRPAGGQIPPVEIPPGGATPAATHLLLHKVLVTAVQISGDASTAPDPAATDAKDSKKTDVSSAPTTSMLVTLALSAPAIEKVVYAGEFGTIWLANEPTNAPEGGTHIVTPGNVYGKGVAR